MRGASTLLGTARTLRTPQTSSFICRQCRTIQISATPSTEARASGDAFGKPMDSRDMAGKIGPLFSSCTPKANILNIDARFEVLGSPYSMLSATLSPSQRLYTRRGTLVALAGKPEDVRLIFSPLAREIYMILTDVFRPNPPCLY